MVTQKQDTPLTTLLRELGVTIGTSFRGYVPKSAENDWEHFDWWCVISIGSRSFGTAYRTGVGHIKPMPKSWLPNEGDGVRRLRWLQSDMAPIAPTAADVIASLASDASDCETVFHDWALSRGYNPDSRKHLDTYLACQAELVTLRRFFGSNLQRIIEAAQEE